MQHLPWICFLRPLASTPLGMELRTILHGTQSDALSQLLGHVQTSFTLKFFKMFTCGNDVLLFQGLPVQVRDHALGMKDDVPKSDVNKEYYTQNVEKEVSVLLSEMKLN